MYKEQELCMFMQSGLYTFDCVREIKQRNGQTVEQPGCCSGRCIRKENDVDRLSALLEDIEEIGRIHLHPDHQTQDFQRYSGQAQEKQANEHNHAERSVQGTGMYSGGCSALCAGRKGEGGLTAEENCGG